MKYITKDDVQHLRNILKVFDQAKFNDIGLKTQMENVTLLSNFSESIRRLELELKQEIKPEPKTEE